MRKEHRYDLGKIDYNRSGRKNCKVALTWTLEHGRFTMHAEVWNPRETDIYTGGQMVEEAVAYFPNDKKAHRMKAIWEEWHLNDLVAGSPAQMEWLKENPVEDRMNYYRSASDALAKVGLNPDPGYLQDGKPYKYGHSWLKKELPAEVIEEIESWSKP
jgi:hypothetical protein